MKKRPTLVDVAKLAGVSKATAARVVSGSHDMVREETRERVMQAVDQLGYERHAIAGSLRSERTGMIALSIPDITNPFWPEVARGVQDSLEQAGYTVVLMNNDWDASREHEHLKRMRYGQFDGLIINPTGTVNSDLLELHVPAVLLGSEVYADFDTVSSDSTQADWLAVEHLITLGHTRIALIAGPVRRRKTYTHYDNFVDIHRHHGLSIHPELIIKSNFSQESGFKAMQELLALPHPPTAVFAVNDILALGALHATQVAGLSVPDDVSIVGMDDIYASATTFPPLTTIAKPKYDIGVTAAEFLRERILDDADMPPRRRLLPCSLIQRSSTARYVT